MVTLSMSEDLSNPLLQERIMKSLSFALPIACFLGLPGCNTVKGMGQDIQKAGSAIEGAAKK